MDFSESKLNDLEAEDLGIHVALSRERHANLDNNFKRVEQSITDATDDIKADIGEIRKLLLWAASTLFATLLLVVLSSVFGRIL
jgi:hypothetical protein